MGDTDASSTGSLQSQLAKWLFSQGASTVLLFAILCFLGIGVPKLLDKHEDDMKFSREKHATELKQTRDDFRATLNEQREDFVDAIERCEQRHTRSGASN